LHIIHHRDWYIIDGKFSVPKTMELWMKLYDDLIAKGFKGFRVDIGRFRLWVLFN